MLINFIIIASVSIITQTVCDETDITPEEIDEYLNLAPEQKHKYDPNDMISKPMLKIQPIENELNSMDLSASETKDCSYEAFKISSCENKLKESFGKISHLESELEAERKASIALRKKWEEAKLTDVNQFYDRILHRFSTLLRFEDQKLEDSKGIAAVRWLVFHVTKNEADTFERHFRGEEVFHEIDNFFQTKVQEEKRNSFLSWQTLLDGASVFIFYFSHHETWLMSLWLLMGVVGVWGFWLFVLDIHRELRWRRVLFMMLIICFAISCVIHWRHMVKLRESRRHSFLVENGLDGDPHCSSAQSLWSKVKVSLFGGVSECERFHEQAMISPVEEISPLMVVSETVSQFLLLPMHHVGLNLGLFFKNFYEHIPLMWQVPATLLFVLMFIILVFATFGYGINFPFWLGGVAPASKRVEGETVQLEKMIKESEERVKVQNELLLSEAKKMLSSISEVAVAQVQNIQAQTYVKPVVSNSASSITKKLDEIISQTLIHRAASLTNWDTLCLTEGNGTRRSLGADSSVDLLDGSVHRTSSPIKNEKSTGASLNYSQDLLLDDSRTEDNSFCPEEFLSKVKQVMLGDDVPSRRKHSNGSPSRRFRDME